MRRPGLIVGSSLADSSLRQCAPLGRMGANRPVFVLGRYAVGFVVLVFLVGCAATAPKAVNTSAPSLPKPLSPPPLDPWAFLPEDAFAVGEIRLDVLQTSPFVQRSLARVKDTLQTSQSSEASESLLLLDVFDRVDSLLFGVSPAGGHSFSLLVQGHFAPDELERLLMDTAPDALQQVEVAGYRGVGDEELLLLRLDERTYLLCDAGPGCAATLARGRARRRPLILNDPILRPQADRVGLGTRPVVAVASIPPEFVDEVAPVDPSAAEEVIGVAVGMALEEGFVMDVLVLVRSPEVAERWVAIGRGAIDELLDEPFADALGLRPSIEAITFAATGNEIEARIAIDERSLLALEERLPTIWDGLLGVALNMP